MDNIQAKTGKKQEDFWKLAIKKHFVKQAKSLQSTLTPFCNFSFSVTIFFR